MASSARKNVATSFLELAASGDVLRAFGTYATENFRHHNPYFRGDAESLAAAMAENAEQNPEKVIEIKHLLEEGDLVVAHARVRLQPDGVDIAIVHIIRFEGDKIAELWDVGQAMPENSPNEYGMF